MMGKSHVAAYSPILAAYGGRTIGRHRWQRLRLAPQSPRWPRPAHPIGLDLQTRGRSACTLAVDAADKTLLNKL